MGLAIVFFPRLQLLLLPVLIDLFIGRAGKAAPVIKGRDQTFDLAFLFS